MCSKTRTPPSTAPSWANLDRLREALDRTDAVVIGAGAGLSAAAGFDYDGVRFRTYFADFEAQYGFHDMYTGGFYPYQTLEEHWAYWSRYIQLNRYEDPPRPVYEQLLRLVEKRDYFVITTNVDHCFQKAGFDKKRLFYTQGDYGLFQCSKPCHSQTYDNQERVAQMVKTQRDLRIPTEEIPRCPRCGRPMAMNLRSDERFVEDAGWKEAAGRYRDFLRRNRGGHILFWEIGVGYNTPGIIKYPFWRMTAENQRAVYACVNEKAACPREIADRSICISGDAGELIREILAREAA